MHLEWVSASEGHKFCETVTEFVEQIRALGPSPRWNRRKIAVLWAASEGKSSHASCFSEVDTPNVYVAVCL
ncbi:MAG: hypothetical protein U9N43_00120 [Euryarchaeota archaeon]|nr:hypothetical protein [Euryarchaeota archaeon]